AVFSRLAHPTRRVGKISAADRARDVKTPARKKQSHAPALAGPATVMRYRCYVTDRGNREAGRLQRAQRRFTSRTRARYLDLKRAHAVLLCLLRGIFGGDLRGIGRRLSRALETHGP